MSDMKLLFYKGKGLVSKAIRFQTRSEYSHVAVRLRDHTVVEAWHVGGVRRLRYPHEGHASGTPVDVFRLDDSFAYDPDLVEAFLLSQLGKKYDFKSVFRFITRRKVVLDDAWFCSELVLAAFAAGGSRLLRGNPSEASPEIASLSPYLVYEKTIYG